jgi:SlyX protein
MAASPSEERESGPLADRLVRLEELSMHFERTLGDLGDVLRRLEKRVDVLEAALNALTRQLPAICEPRPEPRSLEEERPPHY